MQLKLWTFESKEHDVDAVEIFYEKFSGNKTLWLSGRDATDEVLVVVENDGVTKIFPYKPNITKLEEAKINYQGFV